MSEEHQKVQRLHELFSTNLPYFSRRALKIKTKTGEEVPFVFNRAQEYLHSQLERQLLLTGRVRALVLKGRQQGCSTYIGARYYHKATRNRGQSVFILSHEGDTTKKLFRIVERYHENCPVPLRPHAEIANRKEFRFQEINSDYTVGTAGNDNVGRGGTIQLFHGSEVGFWQNTDQIETGIMQSVSDMDGTEIILESTANGMGNMFYEKCMDAIEGKGDYILIFIPWFWQQEYRRAVPDDFQMTREEAALRETYGWDLEQVFWRRKKIEELKSEWKFKQEYPSNIQEAFQTTTATLIHGEAVMRARKSVVRDPNAPLIIGLDPGRVRDRSVFTWRQGRHWIKYREYRFEKGKDEMIQMQLAGIAAQIIDTDAPDKMFIDTGEGWGVVDRLIELGYGDIVQGVSFGMEAIEKETYLNKRAEMACVFRDWIHGENGEVSIPDDDKVHKDLLSMPKEKTNSSGRIQMEPKEVIRAKYRLSPDIFDSIILTFAFPVKKDNNVAQKRFHKIQNSSSVLSTLRRMRQHRR